MTWTIHRIGIDRRPLSLRLLRGIRDGPSKVDMEFPEFPTTYRRSWGTGTEAQSSDSKSTVTLVSPSPAARVAGMQRTQVLPPVLFATGLVSLLFAISAAFDQRWLVASASIVLAAALLASSPTAQRIVGTASSSFRDPLCGCRLGRRGRLQRRAPGRPRRRPWHLLACGCAAHLDYSRPRLGRPRVVAELQPSHRTILPSNPSTPKSVEAP